ncbi:MAG: pyridoxal phosphate-dependent aminotransferase, partial [Gemmatimonadota bacterium]
ARARALREEGRSIVDLSAGEPVWDTPRYAADAGVRAIREGETGYPPTPGVPRLRSAVADYLAETTGRRVEPDRVLVGAGVKQALFNCVYTLFGAGDEVLVPTPCWTSYVPQVRLAGADPVAVPRSWEDGFRLEPGALERRRTDRTRGLLLNSPGNPTGAVFDLPLLEEIAAWADENDVWVLSDEIYRQLHYREGPAPSLFEVHDLPGRSVVLDGVSKAFAMPGWRIGFAVGPEPLISKASDLQSQTTSGAATPSQHAAAAALGDAGRRAEAVSGFLDRLRENRAIVTEGLGEASGLDVRAPDGGIFLFARLRDGRSSADALEGLLTEAGVAAVHGEAFGAPGYLRFSFAVEPDTLREGVRRTVEFFGGRER